MPPVRSSHAAPCHRSPRRADFDATALALLAALAAGCATPRSGPATLAVPGPSSLVCHAQAMYQTPSQRVADEQFGAADAAAAISYSGFTSRGRFDATASAVAAFGDIHTNVAARARDATFRANTALAEAGCNDTLVVASPTRTGSATVILTFVVTSTVAGAAPGAHGHDVPNAEAHLFVRLAGVPDVELGGDPVASGTFSTRPLSVTLGTPFSVGALISAVASIPMNYTADVSASTTVKVSAITIVDATSRPIADAAVRSASGWPWPVSRDAITSGPPGR